MNKEPEHIYNNAYIDFLAIDANQRKINNICWTLITMYQGGKYGKWEDGYLECNIDARLSEFRRDFNSKDCMAVGRLCAALSVALTPLVGGTEELKALLLHMASHMIDVAYANTEETSPVGPSRKRD
jgi:hypothetical protein